MIQSKGRAVLLPSKVPVHKRWIETFVEGILVSLHPDLLKYLSIKDGLKRRVGRCLSVLVCSSKVPVHKRWIETNDSIKRTGRIITASKVPVHKRWIETVVIQTYGLNIGVF